MKSEIYKMTTYTDGFKPYVVTDKTQIFEWLAKALTYKHMGVKDIKRITYSERYDGYIHGRYYISNGTIVEITMPR